MTKKKTKKAASSDTDITIVNVSNHAFWTDRGQVNKNEFGTCSKAVGESLIERGDAEEYKTDA